MVENYNYTYTRPSAKFLDTHMQAQVFDTKQANFAQG